MFFAISLFSYLGTRAEPDVWKAGRFRMRWNNVGEVSDLPLSRQLTHFD